MKGVCITVTLLFITYLTAQAQQKDQNIFLKTTDSSYLKLKEKMDVNVLLFDSMSLRSQTKIDSLQNDFLQYEENLKPKLSDFQNKLDSLKGKLSNRIDSLKNLNLPTEQYSKLLDSLNTSGPVSNVKDAEAKLAILQVKMKEPYNKTNQSISNLNGRVNEKLNLFNKEGGNLSGSSNLQGLNLPGSGKSLPNANLNLNQVNGIKNSLSGTSTPSANLNIPKNGLNGIGNTPGFNFTQPKIEIPKIDLQKSFSEAKEVSGKMNAYSKDLKNIFSGNPESINQLSKDAEKEALKLSELKGLQQNQAELSKYQSMAGQAKDAEALKALGKQEIQKEAINHFAGKEQVLQQTMSKMSSLKKKYSASPQGLRLGTLR